MNIEQNFRHASELPPMSLSELRLREEASANWIILKLAAAILIALIFFMGFMTGRATATQNEKRVTAQAADLSSLYRELDLLFERHVERETKKLCRYEWAMGRSSMWPERVLICGKGKGRAA